MPTDVCARRAVEAIELVGLAGLIMLSFVLAGLWLLYRYDRRQRSGGERWESGRLVRPPARK